MQVNDEDEFTIGQKFKWQFNLKEKSFFFDPLLLSFISFPTNKSFSLSAFFNSFNSAQTNELNLAFKKLLINKEHFEKKLIINLSQTRYIVNFSMHPSDKNTNIIEGSVEYLNQYPNLETENSIYHEIFTQSEVPRVIMTSDHTIITANKVFCNELGYKEHELVGRPALMFRSGLYEPEFYDKLWESVNTNKSWRGELLAMNKEQEIYATELKIERFELKSGDHFYFCTTIKLDFAPSMLTERMPEEINHATIPNKDQYTQNLKKCYEELGSEHTIVVASFSIKWLKKISELTANWLIFQRFQITKHEGNLGSISSKIYSIYWVEEKNPDRIDSKLREIMKAFSYGYDNNEHDLFSNVSMGVSILGVDAKNPNQLISHSTQTLIANPSGDNSSLYYFDRRLATRYDRHKVLSSLLREALNEKRIDVYYQPIVDIPSLKIVKFEALFRMSLETEIDYNTQDLINIAEIHNWVDEVDEMVTKIALDALPRIQKHYKCDDIAMAINRSLANDRASHCCLEDTIKLLLASNANLNNVTIELTESAMFENFEQQKQWVDQLRELGVKVAIDDFGTGYSSFFYLNNLPVNFIKIDRSFVTGITLGSNEYSMIEMLCKLAHKIGAKVIAEGVEEVEDMTVLARAKVDLLQGYLFSKPVSLDTLLNAPPKTYPQTLIDILQQDHAPTLRDIYSKGTKIIEPDDRLSLIKDELEEDSEQKFFIIVDHKKCIGVLQQETYHSAVSPYIGTKGEQKRDLLTLERRVHQLMDKEFYSLNVNSTIETAEKILINKPFSIIVVTNNSDEFLGTVTIKELLNHCQLERSVTATQKLSA